MSVQVKEVQDAAIEIEIYEKLVKEDYKTFVPVIENALESHDKVSLLVRIHDFKGWDAGALWEDLKFDVKHYSDIDKLALVGEHESQKWFATLSKPFTSAEVKFFTEGDLEDARAWIS